MPPTSPALDDVIARLAAAGCVAAAEEAVELAAASPDLTTLDSWLSRREQGEPVAWITGRTTFGGRRLHIAPGLYVPRLQSEELARRAATHLPDHGRALDLCTGAGAVAAYLGASVPTATVIAVDRDVRAAICARRNGVASLVADLDAPIAAIRPFDVVTAVPPYVPTSAMQFLPRDVQAYEPPIALDGGPDGLVLVRRVIDAAGRLLRPGGWLLVEVGGDQDRSVASHLTTVGFENLTTWSDDDGDLRGFAAQLRP